VKHQPFLTLDEWLDFGHLHGYCTEVVCFEHDGIPLTVGEAEAVDNDEMLDHCIYGVRVTI
jgi:hypothetical protein